MISRIKVRDFAHSIIFVDFLGVSFRMKAVSRGRFFEFLGRKRAVLDSLGVFKVHLSKVPRLSFSGETLLGDCLHSM